MEKQRNGKDHEKRRKHAAQRTSQCPGHFSQSVAYVNAHVHGKNARNSLGNGQKVEKVAFVYPLFLFHNFVLNHGQHYIPSANGEKPYAEKRNKKTPICRHHCCL